MFGLPDSTIVKKTIPKKAIFESNLFARTNWKQLLPWQVAYSIAPEYLPASCFSIIRRSINTRVEFA